jgi:hypothetical protein
MKSAASRSSRSNTPSISDIFGAICLSMIAVVIWRKLTPRSSYFCPSGTLRSAITRISTSWSARRSGLKAVSLSSGNPQKSASSCTSSMLLETFAVQNTVDRGRNSLGRLDSIPGFHGP